MTDRFEILMRFPLEGFAFNPENKEGLTVKSPDGKGVLSIKPKRPDEDGFGFRLGVQASILRYVECSSSQRRFIERLINGFLDQYGDTPKPPLYSSGLLSVDNEGALKGGVQFWFDWLPTDIKRLVDCALDCCWQDLDRLLRLLRWQQNSAFRINTRSALSASYWRVDDGLFHLIPERSSETKAYSTGETGCFGWSEAERLDFDQLWPRVEVREPLAHELRNEAETLLYHAPRSALLIAATALEVGVKGHVSHVLPKAEWIMFHVPSPPIFKILRDYLPRLHGDGTRIVDWAALNPLFKNCQRLIEDRNSLTHAGSNIASSDIRNHLATVSDVLYVLDYIDGHDWAAEHLSRGVRKLLDLPEPRHLYQPVEISVLQGPGV